MTRPLHRLSLPSVTLCAATSVNVQATVKAMERCLAHADFAGALLFTHSDIPDIPSAIQTIQIPRIVSANAYSSFLLSDLAHWITTEYVLIVQWDGFILNPASWDDGFLTQDYIGALWPQFDDGANVGNGGFSLRSKRLLEACLDSDFQPSHPEDIAICRTNRHLLQGKYEIRFAPPDLADKFSYERTTARGQPFGFHGIFNMPQAIGNDEFWELYIGLDDPSTLRRDFHSILLAVLGGPKGLRRAALMLKRHWRWLVRLR